MYTNDNPYASPIETLPGEYDHSLFWTLLKISAAFFVFFAAIDCWAWYRYRTIAIRSTGEQASVVEFFRDWSAGQTPRQVK